MDPNALYYALSTIAQCAAALAALIGFLGLWRLDRLRDEERRAEYEVMGAVRRITNRHRDWVQLMGRAFFLQKAHDFVAEPRPAMEPGWEIHDPPTGEQIIKSTLRPTLRRYEALPGAQLRLMRALTRFLILTLAILVLAIVGIPFVGVLRTRPWTFTILIMLASLGLGIGPAYIVREAARSISALGILALLLALASPALAGTTRCTTYEQKTMNQRYTVCDDGTRAVSTWSPTLGRWDTTVTPPPGQTCQGRLNPKTHQWEGRCR